MCFCSQRDLTLELSTGRIELWQLPEQLRGLYYLGEYYGQQYQDRQTLDRITALESECDYLYRSASQGSFTQPLKSSTKTFAELCRLRGDDRLADRIESDWELLLTDKTISRIDLIKQRTESE